MAKDSETVLEGFQEGPLKFPPTYKFDVGTDTYDTRSVEVPTDESPAVPILPHFLEGFYQLEHKRHFLSLSAPHPAGKSVNRLGPTGSCGA